MIVGWNFSPAGEDYSTWTCCCNLCAWSPGGWLVTLFTARFASEEAAEVLCGVWWWQWARLSDTAAIIPCSDERKHGIMSMFLQRWSQLAGSSTHLWQTARLAAAPTLRLPPTPSQSGSTGGGASDRRHWSAGWRHTGGQRCLPATVEPSGGWPCACSPRKRPHLEEAVIIRPSSNISWMVVVSQGTETVTQTIIPFRRTWMKRCKVFRVGDEWRRWAWREASNNWSHSRTSGPV